jgi:hypothetical protein
MLFRPLLLIVSCSTPAAGKKKNGRNGMFRPFKQPVPAAKKTGTGRFPASTSIVQAVYGCRVETSAPDRQTYMDGRNKKPDKTRSFGTHLSYHHTEGKSNIFRAFLTGFPSLFRAGKGFPQAVPSRAEETARRRGEYGAAGGRNGMKRQMLLPFCGESRKKTKKLARICLSRLTNRILRFKLLLNYSDKMFR